MLGFGAKQHLQLHNFIVLRISDIIAVFLARDSDYVRVANTSRANNSVATILIFTKNELWKFPQSNIFELNGSPLSFEA